ncbi:hypothetical protein [Endozoicomonas sp. 4G]|uniref:hypothetical protein n=1 Tax=Endozoicomonas sp. 4G TaxID=2872754 RepID=UPI00207900BA|nr:hypothetical protein [Endozoicomonas sp. 4G]
MLSKKTLILTLAVTFSVHCSNGQTQENRLPLLFVLAVETILLPLFPVRDGLPELDSTVKAIAIAIKQGDDQQREIIETAKQRGRLMLSRFRGDKRPEEPEEVSEAIEWWELKQEPEANHSDMPRVCRDDDILLKPDTRYCFSPDPDVEARAYSRAASDNASDSEDSSTSDESNDNPSDEDEADTETDVQCVNTASDPFRALNEISQYCTTLRLKMIEQGAISDSEVATESEAEVTRLKVHQCSHEGCNYSTNRMGNLKAHKQTHLPADQRIKVHRCGHEGCNYSTNRMGNLKAHKQIHLPADQRIKLHQCGYEGCNYSTDRMGNLRAHKRIHLPVDQRIKVHQCGHEGCDYSTDQTGSLNRHKQTHLPDGQRTRRPKVHQCDYEGCDYGTDRTNDLKKHKQTHLPTDQRAKVKCDHEGCNYITHHPCHLNRHKQTHLPADQRFYLHHCDHEGCNYSTNWTGDLKKHKQTHLPADQRTKRPKRKAYDQQPSNEKRKKVDKE